MTMTLTENVKVTRVSNAVAVGTTDVNSSAIDMKGFESCTFLAAYGTITDGSPSIKAQQSPDGSTGWADLAGTALAFATTDDNKVGAIEVVKPLKRFVRCVVVRGGATGAVVDGIFAFQAGAFGDDVPVVHDATTVKGSEAHHAPSEGVA